MHLSKLQFSESPINSLFLMLWSAFYNRILREIYTNHNQGIPAVENENNWWQCFDMKMKDVEVTRRERNK